MRRTTSCPPLPPRPRDGHKGMFGRVLIVGGSEGMIGAPTMAGRAALKLGAGLVQVAVPRSILTAALTITPELIGLPLGSAASMKELLDSGGKSDAIVIGPGMGQSPAAWARLQRLLRLEKPMVLDADALNLLSRQKRWPSFCRAHAVLTPHPGEMQRLRALLPDRKQSAKDSIPTDDAGRIALAVLAARTFGQTIALKGGRTVVTDAQRVFVNHTGDSSLSKAGTGDVLSGMIAALLAQKMSPFDAAGAAVHLHGRAGEIAGEKLGMRCVLAHDVIDALPQAIGEYEQRYGEG